MKTFRARILVGTGPAIEIHVHAGNAMEAKRLIAAQYGTKILAGPVEVK